jgi:hypothetical protein
VREEQRTRERLEQFEDQRLEVLRELTAALADAVETAGNPKTASRSGKTEPLRLIEQGMASRQKSHTKTYFGYGSGLAASDGAIAFADDYDTRVGA